MAELIYDPPVPAKPSKMGPVPFLQTIRLIGGPGANEGEMGSIRWHSADPQTGVVQLIDIGIATPHRRQGHGKRLMAAAFQQCRLWHTLHECKFRRVWAVLRQKEQVIARAFFTQNGFTHISTLRDLLQQEDALVYFRTFD